MGDSEDEYDRRRVRDKFRRERSDYQDRREDRGRRDDWNDREPWSGRDNRTGSSRRSGDYRDYGNRRDRYSPSRNDMSPPPMKRARHDWDDQGPTQPPMMSFKQFLSSQDDSIDDQEAVRKYGEYKLEFTRQQLNEFFLNHKEEEWFKLKYHPEESTRRSAQLHQALLKRLDIYEQIIVSEYMTNVTLDVDQSDYIIKLLDAVAIKLEGGSDLDLKVLDMPYEEPKVLNNSKAESADNAPEPVSPTKPEEENSEEHKQGKKRKKRMRGYDSDEDSGSESESGEESDQEQPAPDKPSEAKQAEESDEPPADSAEVKDQDEVKEEDGGDENSADAPATSVDDAPNEENEEKDENEKAEDGDEAEKPKEAEESTESRPKALHKSCSIFLRNLAPTITKQEVEAMCKKFPGFLRAAIADPTADRRFFRRGWVTFERTVNIKEICWNLNNIRLRDSEIGAIVNRDLSRRVRSVSGITSHKQIARADIKLAARIIQNLDSKNNLWSADKCEEKTANVQLFSFESSKNPLLKNITDYLIEEASAEEDELLGTSNQQDKEKEGESMIERDDGLLKVLDKMILYLRIVHSFDYYNCIEYPFEDEMPNRCGIVHARGAPPSSKVTQQEVNDFIGHFEHKIKSFLVPHSKCSEEDMIKLGKKHGETEVENFVKANTQELAKDKWLCPLSGKKFKGADFVRKHIFNKHAERVEQVKTEVEYFNNYVMDPKRPQLPEYPAGSRSGHGGHDGGHHYHGNQAGGGGYGRQNYARQGYSRNNYNDPYGRSNNYGHKRAYNNPRDNNRRSGGRPNTMRTDPRGIVHYHDLDAPQDNAY